MKHLLFPGRRFLPVFLPAMLFVTIFCSSCGNTRSLIYMQGKFDTAQLSKVTTTEPIIQKGDILNIIVYSDNPEATKIYNQSLITTAGSSLGGQGASPGGGALGGNSPGGGGYLVDENGNIEFQGLGLIHVDSLTRSALKDTLSARLKDQLTNVYFIIRFLNFRFTMLGEVTRPGSYGIPGDRISLLDALGLAGDLTFYGRRDNILVIREMLGTRQFARLDLTKPEIMASPFFYLQPNDVVIVEPTKAKVAANDQGPIRTLSITTAVVSVFAILYSIFR
jgi:polysaccharide export outer membrane protein